MATPIRTAEPSDDAALAELAEATFKETFLDEFAVPYPPQDLDVFVPSHFGASAFAAMLADPGHAVWILQAPGSPALGYAVVGPCGLPHPDVQPGDGELKRLYLRKAAQGCGGGARLLAQALAWLERDRPGPIWLGVWSGNLKAQDFYRRHGFTKVGEYDFPVGRWLDHEFIFRRG